MTDPLGGINTLFPLFGIANQLLAGIALTVVTVIVIKMGRLKWAMGYPGVPLLWDLTVTLTASWQKIFSSDPAVGYWTQHFQYSAARQAGKTAFGSAADVHQLDAVIRNTFIQGTLSIVFATVVVIVFVAGIIVALKAIRGAGKPPLSEEDPVSSKRFAPSGLLATSAERDVQRQWDSHLPRWDLGALGGAPRGAPGTRCADEVRPSSPRIERDESRYRLRHHPHRRGGRRPRQLPGRLLRRTSIRGRRLSLPTLPGSCDSVWMQPPSATNRAGRCFERSNACSTTPDRRPR